MLKESGHILPGQFSTVGRVSEQKLEKLKTAALEGLEKFQASKSPSKKEKKETPSSPALGTALCSAAHGSHLQLQVQRHLSPPRSLKGPGVSGSPSLPAVVPQDAISGGGGSPKASQSPIAASQAPAQLERPTIAFTSVGMDCDRFCDKSRVLERRFVFPARTEMKPEAQRYNPSYGLVKERSLEADFAERQKHVSPKRPREEAQALSHSPRASQEQWQTISTSMMSTASSCKPEPFRVAPPRLDMVTSSNLNMSEAPDYYKEWSQRDAFSSKAHLPRAAPAFAKVMGRTAFPNTSRWSEPGKLSAKSTLSSKGGILPISGIREASTTGFIDRSLYRGCIHPSNKLIIEFDKDLPRQGHVKPKVYYDEDDTETCERVFRQEMTFDANVADRAVMPRHNCGLIMEHSATRETSLRGSRILQTDRHMQMAQGIDVFGDTESDLRGDIDKDASCRYRTATCVPFYKLQGRSSKQKSTPNLSSLRQPRDMAPPDFARTAPCSGFSTRAAVARPLAEVLRQSRSHDALPNWTAQTV